MLLLGIALILIFCCLSSKVLYRFGIPTLVIFIVIGMMLGADGPGNIYFDNASLAEEISNFALLFIMFYGGFGLDWRKAKSSMKSATVLSTLGVVLTAFVLGSFVHFFFKVDFFEAMVLGSVISSTDAATVFSILNSQKLNLKNRMSYLLEMESGSNDPIAYMITIIFLALAQRESINVPVELFMQLSLGIGLGVIIGFAGVYLINKIEMEIEGLYSILLVGIAILSYSLTSYLGGNGFLAVYLTGIILGNNKIVHRFSLIKYFDGLTWVMQIVLFFTLGLLVFPSQLPAVALDGIIVALFLTFIARPLVVFLTLSFSKYSFKEKIVISWAGFRGAASIVFATYALSSQLATSDWIFNIVFIVALISVLFQGTLFIPIARKLDLVEEEELSLTTFYDESGKISADLLEIDIKEGSNPINSSIIDLDLPDDVRIVMINREGKVIIPTGNTKILLNDKLILAGKRSVLEDIRDRIQSKTLHSTFE